MSGELPSLADIAMVRDAIRVIGMMVMNLDVDGYLRALEYEEAMGPFIDPTAWMRADRRSARTLKQAAVKLAELKRIVMEHEAVYDLSEDGDNNEQ